MPTPKKPTSAAQPPEPPVLVVPRAWLTLLASLIVAPWLVVGAVHWWPAAGTAPPAEASTAAEKPAESLAGGPWGRLEETSITISPPMESVGNEWKKWESAGRAWFFPQTPPDTAAGFLLSAGLNQQQVSALMATARREPGINGVVITPAPEIVRSMSPDVRSRVYVQLAGSALNMSQAFAYRSLDESADAWFGPSLVSPATRRVLEPLLFRHGQHLYFADVDLVLQSVMEPEELRRLAKALLRQKTLRVRLRMLTPAEVAGLADYWGRGGRRTDIGPLLESIVATDSDRTIDIIHLLPSFARDRLYRFPRLRAADLNRPMLANCLWTALNFFEDPPDDRYLDVQHAIDTLQHDYFLIDNRFQLGDIVAFLDEQGDLFHTAVYLADDLVFTKNGGSSMAPWVILPLDTVVDYYRLRSAKPRLLYHRRKNL